MGTQYTPTSLLPGRVLTNVVFIPHRPAKRQQQRRLSRPDGTPNPNRERAFLPITPRVIRHIPLRELACPDQHIIISLADAAIKERGQKERTGIFQMLMRMPMLIRRPSPTGAMRMYVPIRSSGMMVPVSVVGVGCRLGVEERRGEPVLELTVELGLIGCHFGSRLYRDKGRCRE